MSRYKNFFILKFFLILICILIPSFNSAKEILIYADSISYDDDENIIARGNAKIFQDDKLILSDLIIVSFIFPIAVSTVSTALIAAFKSPVCPTMSGFAKLITIRS